MSESSSLAAPASATRSRHPIQASLADQYDNDEQNTSFSSIQTAQEANQQLRQLARTSTPRSRRQSVIRITESPSRQSVVRDLTSNNRDAQVITDSATKQHQPVVKIEDKALCESTAIPTKHDKSSDNDTVVSSNKETLKTKFGDDIYAITEQGLPSGITPEAHRENLRALNYDKYQNFIYETPQFKKTMLSERAQLDLNAIEDYFVALLEKNIEQLSKSNIDDQDQDDQKKSSQSDSQQDPDVFEDTNETSDQLDLDSLKPSNWQVLSCDEHKKPSPLIRRTLDIDELYADTVYIHEDHIIVNKGKRVRIHPVHQLTFKQPMLLVPLKKVNEFSDTIIDVYQGAHNVWYINHRPCAVEKAYKTQSSGDIKPPQGKP